MIFDEEHLDRIATQRHESPEIDLLVAKRDRLLREHPELSAFQKEIDGMLSTTLDPVQRIEILFMVMSERLMAMRAALGEVVRLAGRLAEVETPAGQKTR